eukprot:403350020
MELRIKTYLSQTGIDQLLGKAFSEMTQQKPSEPIVFLSNFLQQRAHLFENMSVTNIHTSQIVTEQEIQEYKSKEQLELQNSLKVNEVKEEQSNKKKVQFQEQEKNEEEYMRPFHKKDQATVTLRVNQDGTIIHNKNKLLTNLNQIKEQDEDGEDDFCEPTQMESIPQHPVYVPKQYLTKRNSDPLTQIWQISHSFNPKTVKDYQNNYVLADGLRGLYLSDIFDSYKSDFLSYHDVMIRRCVENQKILYYQKDEDKESTEQEFELMDYLKKNSIQYQNVISVTELARGGESIVYKLDYVGIDEVVIKQSVKNSSNNDEFVIQSALKNLMSETQQLKLLQSDKFIAEVKEEIIQYDLDSSIIKNYLVVVERARFSLYDLLTIWNVEELSEKYYEYYSPEKLAYYFYQTMQIMAYLHQRDVYYGDMKPHNLLVFKDQLIKIGDLGTTIKMDSSIEDDQKAYLLKGLSTAYSSGQQLDDWQRKIPQSRNELIKADKFSLIRTFVQCIQETKNIKIDSEHSTLCQDMLNDLVGQKALTVILQKYSKFFSESPRFIDKLKDQMKNENKIEAIVHIAYLTKYKLIFEAQLTPLMQNYENQIRPHHELVQAEELDRLNSFYNKEDFIEYKALNDDLSENQIQILMNDINFKTLILEIMDSIKHLLLPNGLTIFMTREFQANFHPYISLNGELSSYLSHKAKQKETTPSEFLKKHGIHIVYLAEYYSMSMMTFQFLTLNDILKDLKDDEVEFKEQILKPLTMSYLKQLGDIPDKANLDDFYDQLDKYKLESSQDARNTTIAFYIKSFVIDDKIEQAQIICEMFGLQDMFLSKQFCFNNSINMAFEYFELLKTSGYAELALHQSYGWLNKYRDLCGDSHEITLNLFGVVGELLLQRKQNQEQIIHGLNYLIKFSKLNIQSYSKFLIILEQHNMETLIKEHLPPYYSIRQFDKKLLDSLYISVFLGQYDEENVVKTLTHINDEMNPKDRFGDQFDNQEGTDINTEKFALMFEVFRSHYTFQVLMRYITSIEITEDSIKFTPQKQYVNSDIEMKNLLEKKLQIYTETFNNLYDMLQIYNLEKKERQRAIEQVKDVLELQ